AVLAHAPSFGLKPALPRGYSERSLWLVIFPVFLGIKSGKVLTDDLAGTIALDPFSTRIPTRHSTFSIEHINGVVGDALHEMPELRFALQQCLLDGLALSEVTGDL